MVPSLFPDPADGRRAGIVLVEGVFLELIEVGIETLRLVRVPVFGVVRILEPMDRGTGSFCQRGSGKMPRRFLGKGYSLSPNATAPVLR